MVGIAARAKHADAERRTAELLVAAPAYCAFPAAQPRMDQPPVADLDAFGIRTHRDDVADILVTHGQWKFHAPISELQPLAAAEIVKAFPDMQIAVADTGSDNLEQDLGPGRLGGRPLHQPQRRSALANVVAFHRTYSSQRRFCFGQG